MPFSWQYLTSLGEGLLGWSSTFYGVSLDSPLQHVDDPEVLHTWLTAGVILSSGFLSRISRFLMAKLETPMFLTLPVPGSFCISIQVFWKSWSGRCFLVSFGLVGVD